MEFEVIPYYLGWDKCTNSENLRSLTRHLTASGSEDSVVTNRCPIRSGWFLDGRASFNSICADRDVCLVVVHPTAGYGPCHTVGEQVFQ